MFGEVGRVGWGGGCVRVCVCVVFLFLFVGWFLLNVNKIKNGHL